MQEVRKESAEPREVSVERGLNLLMQFRETHSQCLQARLLSTPSWLLQAPAKATASREKQPTGSWARVLSLKKAATRHATPVTGHTVCRRGQERLPGEQEDHLSQDEAQQIMNTPIPWASGAAAVGRVLPGHNGAAPGPASAKNHRKGWNIRLSCEVTAEAKLNLCAFLLPSFPVSHSFLGGNGY